MYLNHVWHLFVIRSKQRNELQEYLKKHCIETIIHYPIPPHKQKAFEIYNSFNLPVTENIHQEVLSLPIYPYLTKLEVNKIISVINKF